MSRPPSPPPAAEAGGRSVPLLLAGIFLLAPAAGMPTDLVLQDTLKSALVATGTLVAALLFFGGERLREEPLRWHRILWLPLALAAYAVASMAWSHTYLAGFEALRWLLFALLAWLALNTLGRDRLPLLAWCVHGGAVLASAWAAWQFWGELQLFPQGPQPASTFVNRNFFAEYAVSTLPFGALLLARARSPARIALVAASLGLVLTALLMTGTRGALIAAGLLLVVALPLAAWRCRGALACAHWPRTWTLLAVGLLAGTVLVLGAIPTSNRAIVEEGRGVTPLARGLQRAQSIGPSDYSLGVRMQMWQATLRAIRAHPVAGVGAGAWEVEIPRYQEAGAQLETDYFVHNEYLQLVAEYGLVGWAFALLLAAWLLGAAWRSWRDAGAEADADRPGRAMFVCSLLALLVVSGIGFPWRMAMTGALFALCVGGLAASDARLATPVLARPLRWSPALARVAVAASTLVLVLVLHGTWLAVEAERRLVGALSTALAISASGEPDAPRFEPFKQQLLRDVHEGIAFNPHYRKITPQVGDELARWGDWGNAIRIWESVLASRPNVVVLLTNTARGYDALGDRERAFDYLERAQALRPDAPAVRSLEVLMLARAGQEARALQRAREALDAGIADYDLLNVSHVLAKRAGDYALARSTLEQRMRDWPESRAQGLVQLGLLYAEGTREPEKALAAFRLALQAAPPQQRASLLEQVPADYRARLAPAAQTSASSR